MATLKELYTTLKSLRDMNLPVDDKLLKAADNLEEKIIKETKYCKIISQGKVGEGEYTYSIEKIYIKELKRDEVRF